MGVMVQSAVNAWLKDKSYQIVDITHAIQKARRYPALRDPADLRQYCRDDLPPSSGEGLQETRLKQDVYYLEKTAPQKRKR